MVKTGIVHGEALEWLEEYNRFMDGIVLAKTVYVLDKEEDVYRNRRDDDTPEPDE